MVLSGQNANITVSGSPNVHSTGTHLSPSAGYDHTKSRFFPSAFAVLHPETSPVLFRNRHRIYSPQGSLLRNLDTSLLFLNVNHLSFLMVFPEREAAISFPFVEELSPRTPCGASEPSSWRASCHSSPLLGSRPFKSTLYHRQRLPSYRVAPAYG